MTVFEWDSAKATSNLQKHGVSFEEASTAFFDDNGFTHEDRVKDGERRIQLIGRTETSLLVLVAHTFHGDNDEEIIRILSARRTTRRERKEYEIRAYSI